MFDAESAISKKQIHASCQYGSQTFHGMVLDPKRIDKKEISLPFF
jgi:hypothetical protein